MNSVFLIQIDASFRATLVVGIRSLGVFRVINQLLFLAA
jgi:hypothetical protein